MLASLDAPEREAALADFYERYRDDSLVLDKWFALQAAAQRADTLDVVEALARHPDFSPATRTAGARWSAPSPPTNGRSTMRRAAAIASSPT